MTPQESDGSEFFFRLKFSRQTAPLITFAKAAVINRKKGAVKKNKS